MDKIAVRLGAWVEPLDGEHVLLLVFDKDTGQMLGAGVCPIDAGWWS